ncbi:hypothetical protein BBDE_1618 [Bifidobacterium dentium JCM 1195 = DSM 20436]|nr:hypothetical protein BBDE_1618 [Bifidobacterium dentium JCM 1195 = DSM 20436]
MACCLWSVSWCATRRDLAIRLDSRILSSCGDQSLGETPGSIPNPEAKA